MLSPLSSTGYSNAVYSSQSLFSQPDSFISSPDTNKTGNDTVTISEQGKATSLFSEINTCNGSVTIKSVNQCLENDTAWVEEQLRAIYSKMGLSSDTEMEMSVGYDGKILVSGDSQKAGDVADAINSDPDLANTIRRMSANTSLLEAFKKHQEFAQAYEIDPNAAIEEFAYLLEDGHNYHVAFTISNGSISSQVEYV